MVVFLKQWLILVLMIIGLLISASFQFYHVLYEKDFTYLSWVMFFLLGVGTFIATKNAFRFGLKKDCDNVLLKIKTVGFLGQVCSVLGLCGTTIGFIFMLSSLSDVNLSDPNSTKTLIKNMSHGIGIALYTTLVGQICNILLQVQAFNIKHGVNIVKNESK